MKIIILIVVAIFFVIRHVISVLRFGNVQYQEDIEYLKRNSLSDILNPLVYSLNKKVYDSKAIVTMISDVEFSLYERGSSQILYFKYDVIGLIILWKYKYFMENEITHQKHYDSLKIREIITNEEQIKIANEFYNEIKLKKQKADVRMRNGDYIC